jgi:hypothetical protein
MVSTLIPIEKAAKKWPRHIKRLGRGRFRIRNSSGKPITVPGSVEVYHRGKGRFAAYGLKLDAHRRSGPRKKGEKYRHLGDLGKTHI